MATLRYNWIMGKIVFHQFKADEETWYLWGFGTSGWHNDIRGIWLDPTCEYGTYKRRPVTRKTKSTGWQAENRQNMRYAMTAWRNLTVEQRQQYLDACRAVNVYKLGHNLWCSCYISNDWSVARYVAKASNIPLYIPS